MSKKYKLFVWVGILITLMAALYFGVIADEPITATLSATSVSENMDSGTLVGTLAISCSGTPTAVYLTSGDDSFSLSPTADSKIYNLVTDKAFNYETDAKSYALKVSITDGSNRTEEKDISVSITNVDEVAPVASGSSETTNEDTALSASVSAADSDSVQAMTYAVGTTKVQNGTLVFNTDGSYTYAPAANFSGSDSFTFTAYDGFFTSNEATVDITVAAVNDAPANDKAPTFSGTMHAGNMLAASSGTWNDTADGGTSTLTYSYQWQSSSTDGGTPTDLIGATTENYTLTKADSGKYIRIKQSCSDGTDTAAAYSAWQAVLNNAPVISTTKPVSMAFTEDGAAQELTFSATDADNDSLTWSIKTNGKLGNATISDSKVAYTPTANANGSDSFVVEVSDGMDEDNITVNITITAENDLPVNAKAPSVSGSL